MSYIGLHRVKRGDKYTDNLIYVLDYTSCQVMFWILRFGWICHAILFIFMSASTFLWIRLKPKQTILYTYTPAKGRLNVPAALLMPSAQRWVDNPCYRGTLQIIAFPDQLREAAIDVNMWLLWSSRLRWSVYVVWWALLCKQTFYMTICVLTKLKILIPRSRLYSFG